MNIKQNIGKCCCGATLWFQLSVKSVAVAVVATRLTAFSFTVKAKRREKYSITR